MKKKYFGTDGIRGEVGKSPISPDFVMQLGYAAGRVFSKYWDGHGRQTVLIGKDTRISGYMLESALEAGFCVETLKAALEINIPDIFNTDQGAQFTSKDFTSELQKKNIRISMDHKGRCFDNILVERLWRTLKQEAIFYYRPETVIDLEKCLEKFVIWYNNERLHQSLNYVTPYSVYYA